MHTQSLVQLVFYMISYGLHFVHEHNHQLIFSTPFNPFLFTADAVDRKFASISTAGDSPFVLLVSELNKFLSFTII
ncbi:hypothetical protein QVD17_18104 [Tagetes erecta]|uniref:Uncharacterized protein n=1 Tax=Tagetes erecta TaxID=13708 RepID=A0AAD8KNG9_TARER|nr:hypothetical protein QVD17_18104 [Tagetes erecta]